MVIYSAVQTNENPLELLADTVTVPSPSLQFSQLSNGPGELLF